MNVLKYIELLRKNIGTLKKALIVYLVVLVVFDILIHLGVHGHYYVDNIPAFWMIFGIIGCLVLIKVAKGIAHAFLSKDEDFYG
jgi:uncharacterized ion transporter superfamily protein YfcC